MKFKEKRAGKRTYMNPDIELIKLDNEISLILESEPPIGPDEIVQATQFNQANPFKDTNCI